LNNIGGERITRQIEEIPISENESVKVTRVQQVRQPGDCDKTETFHAFPCTREDRDCEACQRESEERAQQVRKAAEDEQKAKDLQQQIPIDLTPLPQLKAAELLTELQQRTAKRWDEIKAIEKAQNCTRSEAVDQWDKDHGIDRTKTLSLIPATIGHYGGSYIDATPDQIKVLKPLFGNLWPRRTTSSDIGIFFAHSSKGSYLLEALDGIIYKLDYPEYWD
jgi:hypothetical protein